MPDIGNCCGKKESIHAAPEIKPPERKSSSHCPPFVTFRGLWRFRRRGII